MMKRLSPIITLALTFLLITTKDIPCQEKNPVNVTWDKRNIYVNGKVYYIKGISYSLSYGPKYAYSDIPFTVWEDDFKMIKEAGMNTIRTYAPMPIEILDLADKHGLKVIENICYPDEKTDYSSMGDLERLKNTALAYVKRDKIPPSIPHLVIY